MDSFILHIPFSCFNFFSSKNTCLFLNEKNLIFSWFFFHKVRLTCHRVHLFFPRGSQYLLQLKRTRAQTFFIFLSSQLYIHFLGLTAQPASPASALKMRAKKDSKNSTIDEMRYFQKRNKNGQFSSFSFNFYVCPFLIHRRRQGLLFFEKNEGPKRPPEAFKQKSQKAMKKVFFLDYMYVCMYLKIIYIQT